MNAILTKIYQDVRGSYWFLPALMVLGAMALAAFAGVADRYVSGGWLYRLPLIESVKEEDLRAVLSTLAGSMITVAGVTFSMTVVSVSFASAEFGPRLVGNFMRDRGNQFTLGTFISTFVYCLMILGTVQVAPDSSNSTLPRISFLIALVMALGSVAVLIYFIHHIPETINIGNITANVGRSLRAGIDNLFPADIGAAPENISSTPLEDAEIARRKTGNPVIIRGGTGYIQAIDGASLIKIASQNDLLIAIECRPGFFSTDGKALAMAWSDDELDGSVIADLERCFALGSARTSTQDTLFLVDELIEILGRALSPGVCDPFTAMNCIDWLESALGECARRDDVQGRRYDNDNIVRIIVFPVVFDMVVRRVFETSLQYVASDRNAAMQMMRMTAEVAVMTDNEDFRDTLAHQAASLLAASEETLALSAHRRDLRRGYERVMKVISDAPPGYCTRDEDGWLCI